MHAASRNSIAAIALLTVLVLAPFVGGETLDFNQLSIAGSTHHRIFFELRLPRLIMVLAAGGSLAMLGVIYQILFSNPLAEPYLLGISSAVILGAAMGELLFAFPPYGFATASMGFVLALLTCGTILLVHWTSGRESVNRVILFGVGIQFVLSSLLFLLLSFSSETVGGSSLRWMFGRIPWHPATGAATFLLSVLPFMVLSMVFSRGLDAVGMGDSISQSLGFSAKKIRTLAFTLTSIWVALIVSVTGAIGFVGLVTPHAVRLALKPPNTFQLLGWSLIGGGAFLAAADSFSRALAPPLEFPIGIVTSVVGGPLFLLLLWRGRR